MLFWLLEYLRSVELPQEEVLAMVDVPHGKMGSIISKKGSSILAIKQSCMLWSDDTIWC